MKTLNSSRAEASDEYLELVKAFPLRIIRGDQEHQDAIKVLSQLIGREHARLSAGAREYADTLARLIEDFEQEAFPVLATNRSPLAKLKYVMAQSGMTPGKLAEVLGASQPLASHILSGKRNLTAAHMRKLGAHFKIAPGYFL